MLGKKYITIGGLAIPNPSSLSISYENIESVNLSEAGTDLVNVTRLQKRAFSISLKASSFWRAKYKELCMMSQTILELEGEEILVRCRLSSEALIEHTEHAENTNGYWDISIELMEI